MSVVSMSLTSPFASGQDAAAGATALSPTSNQALADTADRTGDVGSSFLSQLAEACHQSGAAGAQSSFSQLSSGFVSGKPLSSALTRAAAASRLDAAPSPQSKATGNETSISQIASGMPTMPPLSAQPGDLLGRQPSAIAAADLQGPDDPQVSAGAAVESASGTQSVTRRSPLAAPANLERQPSTRPSTNHNGPSSDTITLNPLLPGAASSTAVQVSAGLVLFPGNPSEAAKPPGAPGQEPAVLSGDPVDGLASAQAMVAQDPRGDWNDAAAPNVTEDPPVASAASASTVDDPTAMGSAPAMPAIAPASPTASSHNASHAHPGSPPDDQAAASPSVAAPAPSAVSLSTAPESAAGGVRFAASGTVQSAPAGQDVATALSGQSLQTLDIFPAPSATPLDASGAPAQVGESLLTLASSADGGSQISVSLHPKELGAVRVQLDRSPDGTVRILVAASEPSTLRSLMTNQEHLHAALDAAAVPASGRHVSFELAPVTAADASAHAGNSHSDAAGGSSALNAQPNPGMMGFDGFNQRGQGAPSNGTSRSGSNGTGGLNGEDAGLTPQANSVLALRLLPSGSINITA